MTHEFTWRGRTFTLSKHPAHMVSHRAGKMTAAQLAQRPWYIRLVVAGQQRTIRLGDHRTAEAVALAKRVLTQRADDSDALTKALDAIGRPKSEWPTFGTIADLMMDAPVSTTPHTRKGYLSGAKVFIETTLGALPDWRTRTIDVLTPSLIFEFKSVLHRRAQEGHWTDAERARSHRSGNSTLRDIRALFTPALQEFYQIRHGLQMPATLTAFRGAPGFSGAAKATHEYRRPSDDLLGRTLAELQSTRDTHRARFVLIWLALVFGVRKSEAAAVRRGWFVQIDGRMHLELRAVIEPGATTESDLTKNGQEAPRIPVCNGAWAQLAPCLEGLAPEDHVVPAQNMSERRDGHFRAISDWMRQLGWETAKQFHEFRALAGAWLYDHTRDLYQVSRWLRHSSVTITERNYGRYNRTQTTDAAAPIMAALVSRPAVTGPDTTGYMHQTKPNDTSQASFGIISDVADPAQTVNFPTLPTEDTDSEDVKRP